MLTLGPPDLDKGQARGDRAEGARGRALGAQLRAALAASEGLVALVVSSPFHTGVVRQHPDSAPETYRPVRVTVKDVDTEAWIGLPDNPYPASELPHLMADLATRFEHRYVDFVREDNSKFELFQANRGSAPVGYSFDEFYVVPPIARRKTSEASPGLTGTGTDAVNAIAEARRVLLMAGPGAGETTFLRWLAYLAATQYHQEGPWHRVVPFHLSLRSLRITNRAERRSLLGIARWTSVTTVVVNGVPTAPEVAELGELADLRDLHLYEVADGQADDLAAALPGVTVHRHAARMR